MLVSLDELLAESVDDARARESQAFDRLAGDLKNRIVLFGAGGLGRKCLAGLRAHGIEPLAFSDNNPKIWGQQVDGLDVLEPAEAARRYGTSAVFVVTIWGAFSPDRMRDRIDKIHALGCTAAVSFGPLFWKYPEGVLPHYAADLPHRVLEQRDAVRRAYDLWDDETSRREYLAQLHWRLTFDFDAMAPPAREQIYFPPDVIQVRPNEVFVDCGAFDGDSLKLFLEKTQSNFGRIFALEPDPGNFEKLSAAAAALPADIRNRIDLKCAAAGAHEGVIRFSAQGTASSSSGQGDLEVECVTLDRLLAGARPTMIKMDIEGAEPDALRGAAKVIREHRPTLAISGYHLQDHLWSIPLLIESLASGYRFSLRPHDREGWDLVVYAVR